MHEMSLVESIVDLVEDARTKDGFSRVRVIRLKVGALACAEPEALRFCFDAIASGSIAEGARLEIETAAGAGWCFACRRSVAIEERFSACPICRSPHVRPTLGEDLRLVELEVD